jgi:hypothetical protein
VFVVCRFGHSGRIRTWDNISKSQTGSHIALIGLQEIAFGIFASDRIPCIRWPGFLEATSCSCRVIIVMKPTQEQAAVVSIVGPVTLAPLALILPISVRMTCPEWSRPCTVVVQTNPTAALH